MIGRPWDVNMKSQSQLLCNASLKRGPKPLGLAPPQTGLPETLESGFIEIFMGNAPYRRIVFSKSLFSIWVNERLPL